MLEYLRTGPPDPQEGSPLLVLLHGRGSHMGDLQSLVRVVPAGGTLVTPQAPHPGASWGYGSGWAWYRYLGEGQAERESLSQSLLALQEFLEALPGELGFEPGPLVLGGFSQGGTTSLAYAMSHPGHLSGVVNLSGFLVNHGAGLKSLGEIPVFWGHGTEDPAVPFSLAVHGRRQLLEAGVKIQAQDYPMGHFVAGEELADLGSWMESSVPGWR